MRNQIAAKISPYIIHNDHQASQYFKAIRTLVVERKESQDPEKRQQWQEAIEEVYDLIADEIITNLGQPTQAIKFGTSGWRGTLGKDLFLKSVAVVTAAILALYKEAETNPALHSSLGVKSFAEMQERGCVVGFDNRFGGPMLALAVVNVLAANKVKVWYAGEATTGALSASVLMRKAAFSINLTPSHNPLEYGGFKYNAADAGPAAEILTDAITSIACDYIQREVVPFLPSSLDLRHPLGDLPEIYEEDALASWQGLIRQGFAKHGIEYHSLLINYCQNEQIFVCIDAVHGASRDYIKALLGDPGSKRLTLLRNNTDPTFDGIAPEPSSTNMQLAMQTLAKQQVPLKLGAIIDPDGDRIRFTDGVVEISMNQFGAMAYHFLHEVKGKKGMVAKTVATSNLANAVAKKLGEQVFEPKVGFKEFKPVINKALVCFEESDGITVIGHTPEKDAFIGLIIALDMVLTLKKPLGEYLHEIEDQYGHYYPAKDGVTVSQQGEALLSALSALERYTVGSMLIVGTETKKIVEVIAIDGRKMVLEDGSWIMIRPSGTEPKVRFYVEARDPEGTGQLVETAKSLLAETGLLP